MTELEAYPDWAEENLGYQPGGWNGTENGDGILSEFEYSDLGGWMYVENDVSLPVGAGAATVTDNKVYRWMYTVYGYGMDLGIGDGWGMFPAFDNPAYGVTAAAKPSFMQAFFRIPHFPHRFPKAVQPMPHSLRLNPRSPILHPLRLFSPQRPRR